MAQDLESLIGATKVADTVKRDTWTAYQDATSQDDFVARMNKLSIPDTLKRDLWNLKYESPQGVLDLKPKELKKPESGPETRYERVKRLATDFGKRFTMRDVYQAGGAVIGAGLTSPAEAANVVAPGLGLATNVAGASLGAAGMGQLYDYLFGDPNRNPWKAIPMDLAVGATGAGGAMELITSAVKAPVTELMVEGVSKKMASQEASAAAQFVKTYLGEELGSYAGPLISRLSGLEPEHGKLAGKAIGTVVGYLSERPFWKAASVQTRIMALRLLNNGYVDDAVNLLLTDALQHGSEVGSAAVMPTVQRQGEKGRAAFIERMKEFQKQTGAYPQGRFRPAGQQ